MEGEDEDEISQEITALLGELYNDAGTGNDIFLSQFFWRIKKKLLVKCRFL